MTARNRTRASAKKAGTAHETECASCGAIRRLKHPPVGKVCRKCAAAIGTLSAAEKNRIDPLARLRAKYEVKKSGCWIWAASLRTNGYGQMYFRGRMTESHRVSYILHRGEIEAGKQLDHLCRVRSCCNPWHLEVVTPKVNTLRGVSPSAINQRKTHCPHGHEFTSENTYIERLRNSDRVKRHCRTCRRAVQQRARRSA